MMDKTAEIYDFALAWVMQYDTRDTMQDWWKSLSVSFNDYKAFTTKAKWWVASMQQIKNWERTQ